MSLHRREVLSIGVTALCGCTALGSSERSRRDIRGPSQWEAYGRGPTHRASYEQGTIPSAPPSTDRTFELNGNVITSPVASEHHLVIGDERGVLVVPFDNRELPRRIEPSGAVAGTPCLTDQTVYVTSDGRDGQGDGSSVSAMTMDGEATWQTELSADGITAPTVRNGTVFVRSSERYLALDADTGEIRWQNSDADRLPSVDTLTFENFGPAVGRDAVVFPDGDGITATDPRNGDIRWRSRLQMVRSCPVIAEGVVYVADVKSGIHAFDLATGDRKWEWSGAGCWSPPAVSNERVYATERDDIIALDQVTGDLEWRTPNHGLHGGVQSGISVVGETILASSSSFGLASVRTESDGRGDPGTKRWTLGRGGFTTPIVVDNRIVFVEYGEDNASLRVVTD